MSIHDTTTEVERALYATAYQGYLWCGYGKGWQAEFLFFRDSAAMEWVNGDTARRCIAEVKLPVHYEPRLSPHAHAEGGDAVTPKELAAYMAANPEVQVSLAAPAPVKVAEGVVLNTKHPAAHEAADAFWNYWRANGETHKHGYYESTWGAINAAIRMVGVVPTTGDNS